MCHCKKSGHFSLALKWCDQNGCCCNQLWDNVKWSVIWFFWIYSITLKKPKLQKRISYVSYGHIFKHYNLFQFLRQRIFQHVLVFRQIIGKSQVEILRIHLNVLDTASPLMHVAAQA